MTGEMASWLKEHIATTTGAPPGGRYAHARHCPRCGLVIIVGLDADICALTRRLDPTPLSPLGEATAVHQLRWRTARLQRDVRQRLVIDQRDHYARRRQPPTEGATYDVLVDHHCGTNVPAHYALPSNLDTLASSSATSRVNGQRRPAIGPATDGGSPTTHSTA